MTEQANIMVSGFKDVMKCLLEQRKWTFEQKTTLYLSALFLSLRLRIYETNICIVCLTFFLNYTLLDKIITNCIAYVLYLIADFIFRGDVNLRLIVNILVRLVKILKFQAKIMYNNKSSNCTSNSFKFLLILF